MAKDTKFEYDPVPKQYALLNKKLSLTAKRLEGGDFPPSLNWDFYGINPRLIFKGGYKQGNGPENSYFMARMDLFTAQSVCNIIRSFAMSKEDACEPIAVTCDKPKEGGKSWETQPDARVYVGRDKDGVYISAVAKASSFNVKFYIEPAIYHKYIGSDNAPLGLAERLRYYVMAYADTISDLLTLHVHETSYRGSVGEATVFDKYGKSDKSKSNDTRSSSEPSSSSSSEPTWNGDWG